MKWIFYVIVFIYMGYRAVYGAKTKTISSITVEPVDYSEFGNFFPPGTVKTIPCIYNTKFQQVEWIDPSGNAISSLKSNRIFTQKHQVQTLYGGRNPALLLSITDAWVEDSGVYECRSDELSEVVSLCIIDPLNFVDTPSEVSVDEGRSFTLTCEARGRPEPSLVWYRNNEIISDDCNSTKYKVMTKFNSQGFQGQLTITSIEPDDAGIYTCEAIQEHKDLEDCSVKKDWNITLNVNHAPIFEDGNLTVLFAKVNESVDLVCEPRAHPNPSFRWFSEVDDGTLVNFPPEKITTSEDKSKTGITIVANAVSFGMKYDCRATNTYGYASKTFTVLEIKKPKQPYEVTVSNYTDSRIDLNVQWEDDVLFPIDEILIQSLEKEGKQKAPRESEWRRIKEQPFELGDRVAAENSIVKVYLTDLKPETDYWIRLRAVNELGLSPWSNAIMASTDRNETEDTSETDGVETTSRPIDLKSLNESRTDPIFYGIFFAGGILVFSFLCMLLVRLV